MKRAYEDFAVGDAGRVTGRAVTRDAILAFAEAYDPQPFHLDETAAAGTFVGELIASGWHVCALGMRLIADGILNDSLSQGAPGVEEVVWKKPVRPGDRLDLVWEVIEAKASRSRPSLGLLRFRFDLRNQADETVMTQINWIMLGRREAAA